MWRCGLMARYELSWLSCAPCAINICMVFIIYLCESLLDRIIKLRTNFILEISMWFKSFRIYWLAKYVRIIFIIMFLTANSVLHWAFANYAQTFCNVVFQHVPDMWLLSITLELNTETFVGENVCELMEKKFLWRKLSQIARWWHQKFRATKFRGENFRE